MKKIVVFFTGLLFFSTPVFAQKLGSATNPNVSGSAGAFAVYTPQEIKHLEEAGREERFSVRGSDDSNQVRFRRRPNYWVLSGGQLTKEEEEEMYGKPTEVVEKDKSNSEENVQESKTSSKSKSTSAIAKQSALTQAAVSSPTGNDPSLAATSSGSSEITPLQNTEDSSLTEEGTVNSLGEGDLVCRKYEKCAICERQKPYWNGRECASARKIAKMKKRDKAQAAQNRNRNNNGARRNAVSERAEENSSANANNASAEQGQNVQGNDAGTQQQDPTLNPDGTPKTKRQLRREQREARKAAAKNKK